MEERPPRRGFLDRLGLSGPLGTIVVGVSDRAFSPGEEFRADVVVSLNRPAVVQALKCSFSGTEAALGPMSPEEIPAQAKAPGRRILFQTATRQHDIVLDVRRLDAPEGAGPSTLEAGTRTYTALFRVPEDALPSLSGQSCGSVHYRVSASTEPRDALKAVSRLVHVRASRPLPLPDPDPGATLLEPSPQGLSVSLDTPPECNFDEPLRGRVIFSNPQRFPISRLTVSLLQIMSALGPSGVARAEDCPTRDVFDYSRSRPLTGVDTVQPFEFRPPGDRTAITPSFRGTIVSVSHALEAVAESGPGGRARSRRPVALLSGDMV